ncbi:MAG: reverse transcriptase domain-containing protein, partial [Bacteroidota bacterium]
MGPDKVPVWILKEYADELTVPVTLLFNKSLLEGKVPQLMKSANIIPIAKVKQPQQCSDFRPVSVTPILARLLERLIVKKFVANAVAKVLHRDQFAFRKGCSTEHALLKIQHIIGKFLDQKECRYVRTFLVDFSKAFDLVNHKLLLEKVCNLDIPAYIYNWLKDFLTN